MREAELGVTALLEATLPRMELPPLRDHVTNFHPDNRGVLRIMTNEFHGRLVQEPSLCFEDNSFTIMNSQFKCSTTPITPITIIYLYRRPCQTSAQLDSFFNALNSFIMQATSSKSDTMADFYIHVTADRSSTVGDNSANTNKQELFMAQHSENQRMFSHK
jgi:hypothetical protein